MYIRLAIERIKSNLRTYIINFLGIVFSIALGLVLLGYYSSHRSSIDQQLLFSETAILIRDQTSVSDQEQINNAMDETGIDYVLINTGSLSASGSGQSVIINYYDNDPVIFGALSYDYDVQKYTVEDVDYLYGGFWNSTSNDPIIVDEYTAIATFGMINVVGYQINVLNDNYTIVGVISNTSQRAGEYDRCVASGDNCFLADTPSNVYLPYDESTMQTDYRIGKLTSKEQLETLLSNLTESGTINLGLADKIIYRDQVIEALVGASELFYTALIFVSSVVIFLGLMNLINTYSFTTLHNLKQRKRLTYLGYSDGNIFFLDFTEGVIVGFGVSLVSCLISLIILILVLLGAGLLRYFDLGYFLKMVAIVLVGLPILMAFLKSTLGYIIHIVFRKKRGLEGDISDL
ncbi:MAG: ABC transporter permease [Bacilli bacterium]|nr:ABC transporter permease [Bacilli bacterium]MBN2877686.1 ABC transporter permease [Bacilli bacterium]